jgi:hypothetical protein
MSNLDLYLSELDENTALTVASDWDVSGVPGAPTTIETLYYQQDVAVWQRVFNFASDVSVNVINENVLLSTVQGENVVGDASATISSASTSDLYTASTTTGDDNYTTGKINDSATISGSSDAPRCNLDFQKELSRAVFGTPLGIDLFNNEGEVKTSFGTGIETMAASICAKFNSAAGTVAAGSAAESSGTASLQVCNKIFQQILASYPERYTLVHNATVNGTPEDGTSLVVTSTSGSGATVDLFMNAGNTAVEQMNVVATGSGYAKGETATFTYSAGNTITIELNSVQAAILNGTLQLATELPIEAGDIFNAVLTVKNNATQTNVAGLVLNTIGDEVERKYLLKMKMV